MQNNLRTQIRKSKKILARRPTQLQTEKQKEPSIHSLNSWIRQQGSTLMLNEKWENSRCFNYLIKTSIKNKLPIIQKQEFFNKYHLKCIHDVLEHNEPRHMSINDPKELIYIKQLPNLKMSVIGIGRTNEILWELKNDLSLAIR